MNRPSTATKIEVNPGRVDLEALSDLLASAGMRAREPKLMRAALDHSSIVVVARRGAKMIGFGRMVDDAVYYGGIWDVAVAPEYQKRGIGTRMVRAMVGEAKKRGLYMVGLFTAAGNKDFYERIGFEFHDDYHAMTLKL